VEVSCIFIQNFRGAGGNYLAIKVSAMELGLGMT